MLRLAGQGREEIAVVDDQVGCPTWTGHLAPALVQMCSPDVGPGVAHVAGCGRASWNQLAREVFALAGLEVAVTPASSEQMRRPAPRPPYSVLASERADVPRLPDWQEGVRCHLADVNRKAAPVAAGGGR
jgi:dTDP-4-dehydrorhamnose reductase